MSSCAVVFDPRIEHDGIANFDAYSNVGTFRYSGIVNFSFRNRPNLVFKSKYLSLLRARPVCNAMMVFLAFNYKWAAHNRTNFLSKSIKQYTEQQQQTNQKKHLLITTKIIPSKWKVKFLFCLIETLTLSKTNKITVI